MLPGPEHSEEAAELPGHVGTVLNMSAEQLAATVSTHLTFWNHTVAMYRPHSDTEGSTPETGPVWDSPVDQEITWKALNSLLDKPGAYAPHECAYCPHVFALCSL